MGNQGQKAPPPPAPRDPMDIILDLRMTKKRLEAEARKAEKDSQKDQAKAKEALKKNNEESARLFLQNAMNKKQESQNLQKMAQKIEFVEIQVKSSQANQEMITQLNRVTPIMTKYTQEMPTEQLYQNITQFDNALDDLMVQGKMMDQMMNKNQNDFQTNMQVDAMMQQMRREEQIRLEELNPQQQQFVNLPQQQQQQQQGYQQQQQYKY